MTDALIGYSGFVGSAILRSRSFDQHYRSTNIDEIRGKALDLVVCCGAPAEKWRANKDPEEDRARLATLTNALEEVSASRFLLISTVDVYPVPHDVDERTAIDPANAQPYGRHRYELEEFCADHFSATIIRLPGLYGHGLKKNAVFDMLHRRPMDGVPANATFQFYNADRVWPDAERVLSSGESLVNITAEPVAIGEVAERIFHRTLPLRYSESAPRYDVKSIHAALVGGRDGYWFDADATFAGLQRFAETEAPR